MGSHKRSPDKEAFRRQQRAFWLPAARKLRHKQQLQQRSVQTAADENAAGKDAMTQKLDAIGQLVMELHCCLVGSWTGQAVAEQAAVTTENLLQVVSPESSQLQANAAPFVPTSKPAPAPAATTAPAPVAAAKAGASVLEEERESRESKTALAPVAATIQVPAAENKECREIRRQPLEVLRFRTLASQSSEEEQEEETMEALLAKHKAEREALAANHREQWSVAHTLVEQSVPSTLAAAAAAAAAAAMKEPREEESHESSWHNESSSDDNWDQEPFDASYSSADARQGMLLPSKELPAETPCMQPPGQQTRQQQRQGVRYEFLETTHDLEGESEADATVNIRVPPATQKNDVEVTFRRTHLKVKVRGHEMQPAVIDGEFCGAIDPDGSSWALEGCGEDRTLCLMIEKIKGGILWHHLLKQNETGP